MVIYTVTLLAALRPYSSFNTFIFNNLDVINLSLYVILHGHNCRFFFAPSRLKYNQCIPSIFIGIFCNRKKDMLKTLLKVNGIERNVKPTFHMNKPDYSICLLQWFADMGSDVIDRIRLRSCVEKQ